jgi:hypothetical protein
LKDLGVDGKIQWRALVDIVKKPSDFKNVYQRQASA